jgi:uncharacterized protein
MANPVAWFEITGPDAAALQSFYSQAFDWEIDADNEMSYGMVTAGQGGIRGGISPDPQGGHYSTFYVAVDDVDATLAKVTELGAEVMMPPMDVPGGPRIAFFTDPAGNQVGLMTVMQ